MKKLLVLVAMMAFFSTASFAQFKYGGGLTFGSKVSLENDINENTGSNFKEKLGVGVNLRGDYSFSDKLTGSPGFTLFFPSTPDDQKYTLWQVNTDAHYYFYDLDNVNIYGLGGINLTYVHIDGFGSQNELGLDLGAGVNYDKFFGELKYDTALEQVALTLGILF